MKKRLIISVLAILVMIFNIATISFAANENVTVTATEDDVKSGDTFEVTVSQESDGITGIESTLSYDTDVFSLTKRELETNWTDLGNDTKLDAMSNTAISSGNVFKLTFSVKEGVSPVTSEIKLTGIKLYKNSTDSVTVADKTVSIDVNGGTPEEVTLSKIAVTQAPTTTEYTEGQTFNTAGMVVTATYSDNTTKAVTNYTYSPKDKLSTDNKLITISYTEGEVTKTATQSITVKAKSDNNNSSSELKGITLDKSNLTLVLGVTTKMNLIAYANPINASLPEIVWSSSDEKIAKLEKMDTNGSVTVVPVAVGTVTITAKTADGKYSATCKITVNANGNVSGNTTNVTKVTSTNTSDNTTTTSSLPKTGSTTKYILLIVAGLICIAFVSYVGYRKNENSD